MIRSSILLLLGVLLGYFVAGVWPIAGWVLELLRRGIQ